MKSFRSKPVGWRGESQRHSLAARGYYSKKYYAYTPTYVAGDLPAIGADAVGTAGAAVVPWIPVIVPLALVYGGTKYMKNRKKKTGSYFAEQEDMMSFSPADLQAFDAEMESAKERGDDQFMFKGKPVLVAYGKYLSEYLHGKFDQQHFAKKDSFEDEFRKVMEIDKDLSKMSDEELMKELKKNEYERKEEQKFVMDPELHLSEERQDKFELGIEIREEKSDKIRKELGKRNVEEEERYFAKKREELPSWETTQNAADKLALDEARYRQEEKLARSVEEMYPAAVTSGEFRPSMKHAKNAASAELNLGLVENILGDIEEREDME